MNNVPTTLPTTDTLIHLRQVTKTFEAESGVYTALKAIDLHIKAGEFVAIVGKSGSGKTTLLNMLTGIDRPTAGEVWVNQTALHTLTEPQLAAWRGRQVGIVFQFFQLLPVLTALENVMLPMELAHLYTPRVRRERAAQLLAQVDMTDCAHKLPGKLSGGQQQRVAIARALANDPPLLVTDEPTGNLDSQTAAAVFQLFQDWSAKGKTIVMVTHDPALAHGALRTVTIADGKISEESIG